MSARAPLGGRRTVVIAQGVGRLANRLTLFAHFIGAALEHGFTVANPAFGIYAHHFPSTAGDPLCRFPAGRPWIVPRVCRRPIYRATRRVADLLQRRQQAGRDVGLIRLARAQHLDLDSEAFLSVLRRHRFVFVEDWYFRSAADVARHGAAIRAFLTPRPETLARAAAAVERARQAGDLVVGVHVRRGDYERFKGGRYFYSHEEYGAMLARVERSFSAHRVSFLVGSDEPLPAGAFAGHRVANAPGAAVEDLYAFAGCDRLIGPPSTFTAFASFHGRVPVAFVESAGTVLDASSFRTIEGLESPGSTDLEAWTDATPAED